jgi:hypothetical protein
MLFTGRLRHREERRKQGPRFPDAPDQGTELVLTNEVGNELKGPGYVISAHAAR